MNLWNRAKKAGKRDHTAQKLDSDDLSQQQHGEKQQKSPPTLGEHTAGRAHTANTPLNRAFLVGRLAQPSALADGAVLDMRLDGSIHLT